MHTKLFIFFFHHEIAYIEDGKRVGDCLVSFHQKCVQADADPILGLFIF